jgi:pimeloyl-ACP methyl ester carboxylesterase
MEERVTFYSEGTKVAGILGIPDGPGPRAAVILCHGFSMVKEIWLPENARRFREAGYVTLLFDYRFFGESGGEPRQRLIPMAQVADVKNAITYLETRREVRADRIGLYGTSFGCGNVSYVAGTDDRVRATVGVAGPGDCERVYRSGPKFDEFMAKVRAARQKLVATGEVTYLSSSRLMARDPGTAEKLDRAHKDFPGWRPEVTFESLLDIVAFRPESVVERIAPRPILWIHPEKDGLVPLFEAQSLYAKARHPKKLVVLEGMDHVAIYEGEGRDRVMKEALAFFREHMPAGA